MPRTPYAPSTFIATLNKYKNLLEALADDEQLFPLRFIAHYYAAAGHPEREVIIREADRLAAAAAATFLRHLSETKTNIRNQPGFQDTLGGYFAATQSAAASAHAAYMQQPAADAAIAPRAAAMRSRISSSQAPVSGMKLPEEFDRAPSIEPGRSSVFFLQSLVQQRSIMPVLRVPLAQMHDYLPAPKRIWN